MSETPVQTLIRLARGHRVAELYYRKGATDHTIKPRLIEAYNWTEGKQDIMVRAYQIAPEEGWRFFMVHKIARVGDGGVDFHPRKPVSLPDGVVTEAYEPSPHWEDPRRAYRDLVSDALADGKIDRDEAAAINKFVSESGLTEADKRYVHASLYHRCLGAVLDDGFLDDVELMQIWFLHEVFKRLGWHVGQRPPGV